MRGTLFSCMSFLQYTQEVHIHMGCVAFTPNIPHPSTTFGPSIKPGALTVGSYDAVVWRDHYRSSFIYFYLTLTSLELHSPPNHHPCVLQFAPQFSNIDHSCIERPGK